MSTAGKPIDCLAAVMWEPNKPLTIETVQVAPPKTGEVRVKMVSASLCRTDAHAHAATIDHGVQPCILGHEGAGVVESVGQDVTSVKPGDHVLTIFMPRCRNCVYCKNPKSNYCIIKTTSAGGRYMPDGTTRFTCKGKPINHYLWCSSFSQYTVLSEGAVAKINPKAPLDKVCVLGCGIPSGYGAAINAARIEPGTSCVVWGLGGVGLAVVMGCKEAGASKIIGVDTNPNKSKAAFEFGCTDFINPKDHRKHVSEVIKGMTSGYGVDYSFECVGTPETTIEALRSCNMTWGECIMIGASPATANISIHCSDLLVGRRWRGCMLGDYKGRDDLPALVDRYLDGTLKVDEFISQTFTLNDINKAFEVQKTGDSIRSVIIF